MTFFKYAVKAALNHKDIEIRPGKISEKAIGPFTDQHEWEVRNFPTGSKKEKKFETNNKTNALNVLLKQSNSEGTEKIRQTYISKHNSKRKNQVIILIITGSEKRCYLTVTKISRLLHEITSKRNDDSYCSR